MGYGPRGFVYLGSDSGVVPTNQLQVVIEQRTAAGNRCSSVLPLH